MYMLAIKLTLKKHFQAVLGRGLGSAEANCQIFSTLKAAPLVLNQPSTQLIQLTQDHVRNSDSVQSVTWDHDHYHRNK